jgi:tetratricopeptide (TPR) repeat protein
MSFIFKKKKKQQQEEEQQERDADDGIPPRSAAASMLEFSGQLDVLRSSIMLEGEEGETEPKELRRTASSAGSLDSVMRNIDRKKSGELGSGAWLSGRSQTDSHAGPAALSSPKFTLGGQRGPTPADGAIGNRDRAVSRDRSVNISSERTPEAVAAALDLRMQAQARQQASDRGANSGRFASISGSMSAPPVRKGLRSELKQLFVSAKQHSMQGDYVRAQEGFEQALQRALELPEGDGKSSSVAAVHYEIADTSKKQGDFDRALAEYNTALRLFRSGGPRQDAHVAQAQSGLSLVYLELGSFTRALREARESLEVQLRLAHDSKQGHHHGRSAAVATSRNNLGSIFREKGDYEAALEEFRTAFEIASALGDSSGDELVAATRNNVAGVHKNQGDFDRALSEYRLALDTYLASYGESHPLVAKMRNNIAGVQKDLNRFAESVVEYGKALATFVEVLGPQHPDVATTRVNLANVYEEQGDLDRAAAEYQTALEAFLETYDGSHPVVATTRNNLACVFREQGKFDEANTFCMQALNARLKTFGDLHPDVAVSRLSMARLYQKQQMFKPALQQCGFAAATFFRFFGPVHARTKEAQLLSAELQKQLGGISAVGSDTNQPFESSSLAASSLAASSLALADTGPVDDAASAKMPSMLLADLPKRQFPGVRHEVIGAGAAANVFRCTFNGDDYALKTMKADLFPCYEREVEAMRACSHDNVARVFDYGATEAEVWFQLELFSTNLNDLASRRATDGRAGRAPFYFSAAEIRRIVLDIMRAMEYIHVHQGIAHCDIKVRRSGACFFLTPPHPLVISSR